MRFFIITLIALISIRSNAQQSLFFKVTGGEDKSVVAATIVIKGTGRHYVADTFGITSISFNSNGSYTVVTSAVGHEERVSKITIPYPSDTLEIELESSENEMEEVVVQSTRTSRTITNVPTRVETIELEEIDEKNNM
jgi:iron complex outermembrane receptor protein/outer membrane receptor for ferrienterochelin and colicins